MDPNRFKTEGIKATLRQTRLFEGLDMDSLEMVAEACAIKSVPKGSSLFHQGQKSWGFYVVQSGVVALYNTRPDGVEQVIALFEKNDSFAEATLVATETYPAHARAESATQVILVKKLEFKAIIGRNPDLALRMLASMSQHLKHLVHLLADRKFSDIEGRFARWLIEYHDSHSSDGNGVLELPVSKRLLASQLGVAGETLSRTLNRLREEGVISVDGKRIEILDYTRLAQHAV